MARRKRKRPHRSGSIFTRGARTVIQWRDIHGIRHTRSYDDRITAERDLARFASQTKDGMETVAPSAPPSGTVLDQHFELWSRTRTDHSSHYDERGRWSNHWSPLIGKLTPKQLDVSRLKRAILALREKGLSKGTVGVCVALVSALYTDLVEEGSATFNPVQLLSKKTRREHMKSDHDPKSVPFVRDPKDVVRIYLQLLVKTPDIAVAYAVGALAGLRPGEVRALDWSAIDLERRTITVSEQVQDYLKTSRELWTEDGKKHLKDNEVRIVPIMDSLFPILVDQRRRNGGLGLVCPPRHPGRTKSGRPRFLRDHTLAATLARALDKLGIEPMVWYHATRHTFASQWVLHGGSLEKLREMMGHSSVMVTERYAHLIPGRFTDVDRARVQIDVKVPVVEQREGPALPVN